jgi:hypothetical protein
MLRWALTLFLAGAGLLHAAGHAQAIAQLNKIPLPLQQSDWSKVGQAPVTVTVKASGVFINNFARPVPFDQVLEALAALPRKTWGAGRYLLFWNSPPGIHRISDEPTPEESRQVADQLKLVTFVYVPAISA